MKEKEKKRTNLKELTRDKLKKRKKTTKQKGRNGEEEKE